MIEASHALGLSNDTKTYVTAKKMVDHAIEKGWDDTLGGFYDEGYYFNGETYEVLRDTKTWWAQAEGLNALLLMAHLYPEDERKYYDHFLQLWDYTDRYLIDHEYGDW